MWKAAASLCHRLSAIGDSVTMKTSFGGKGILRTFAILTVATFLMSGMQARAAVAVDSATSGAALWAGPTPAALTFSHTTTGSNTLLIVAISLNITNSTGTTVNTVTYGSSSLTKINAQTTGNRRVEFWSLPNAPAGTATVTITPTAIANNRHVGVVAGAITFTGVDPTTPFGTPTFIGNTSTTPSTTITSNPNQLVLDTVAATGWTNSGNTTISVGPGQTQEWNANSNGLTGNDVVGSGSVENGASSVTMSDTLSRSTAWEIGVLPIFGAATNSLCATPGNDGVGNVTGVVNAYYAPSAATVLGPGSTSVALSAGVGANTDINAGDLLLIMQMQDADINSTNTSAYGAGTTTGSGYTALNSAGLYEYVVAANSVTFAAGGTLNFTGAGAGGGVVNKYTEAAFQAGVSGQSTFQVIRVPQYTSATLGNGGNVAVATAWNGAVGGVFAIDVDSTLTLNGTVNVDALGFRGGGGRTLTGGTGASTDYRTASTDATNGSKGEGIAGTPQYLISSAGTLTNTTIDGLPNGSYARGAPGNAGGGGTDADPPANDQNTGGGGGANGGAGGLGGNSWNTNVASGGIGGTAFPATISRVTMGGGGGAGTSNNGTSYPNTNTTGINSSGGTGGGLVMIRANQITGTGTISANGASTLSTQNDSTGGGGAGGTIVVVAQNSGLSGLTVSAAGGNGGNAWPAQAPGSPCPGGSACNYHGPGGGGGGGVVLLSSAAASTNVSGGQNGTTTTAAVAYGATPGGSGVFSTTATLAGMGGASSGAQCVPDLTIAGSGLSGLIRGSTWSYNLTVSNAGILSTSGLVTVDDPLPYGLSVTNVSGTGWSCSQSGQDVTCTRSDALNGFSASYPAISLSGSVIQSAPNSVTNTATTSGGGETYLGNDSTTTTSSVTSSADLSLTSTPSTNLVAANGVLTYTQVVTNNGISDASGLFFTSVIPANTTFQSITIPSGWSCTTPAVGSAGTVSCVATYLAAGASATFAIVTGVNNGVANGTILTNTASVNSLTSDPIASNNFTTTKVTVGTAAQSDLAITDVATPTTAAVGSQITFTHVVTYTGAASATNLTYTEALPANTTAVTAPGAAGWTCSPTPPYTCTISTLATNSSVTFTTTVQINGGTTISDTATIASSPADTYTANNSATATVNVTSSAGTDLSLTDQASPVSVEAGSNVIFAHNIVNNGPNTSGTITLTDTLPAGTTYVSYSAPPNFSCSNASNVVTCTGSGLAVGAQATIEVTTSVPSTTASGTVLTDSATVSNSTGDPVAGNNNATATSTVATATDLAVTISGSPNPIPDTGGTLTLTANVTNNGPTNAGNTTFRITVPSNTTFVSINNPGGIWSCNPPSGGVILCTVSDLPVGYNANFVLTLTAPALADNTAITSTATITPNNISDKIPANNTAVFNGVVSSASQVTLGLAYASSPVPVTAGSTLTLSGTATNSGPGSAAGAKLVIPIPAGTTLAQSFTPPAGTTCTPSISVGGTGTFTCNFTSSVPSGTSVPWTLTVKVNSNQTSSITANATFTSTTNAPNGSAATASASVVTPVTTSADISVSDSCTPDQVAGSNIVCTQTITNLGPSDAQGVVLTEATPANTTLVSATGSSCGVLLGTVTCNVGTVAVGSPVTITYTTKINAGVTRGTSITDTVNVTTTTTDPVSTNNTATSNTTVALASDADIAITNSPSATSVSSGSNITYTQTITNNGPTTSGIVTVNETVPANTTYVSASGTGWTCLAPVNGVFTCTSTGTLASGASSSITFVVTANSGLAAGTVISDTATAPAAAIDPNSANNTATANTTIADPNQADVSIAMSAASTTVRDGMPATFTLTASNAGPTTATDTIVTIPIPSLEQFVSATPSQGSCSMNGSTVTCALGSIVSSGSATISVVTNVINYGTTTNTATISADQTDPNLTNNTTSVAMLMLSPTEVKLVGFDASWINSQVVLEWRTKEEVRNLGFNVYREVNGQRVKLNSSLIAGSAVRMRVYLPQHTASAYTWIDPTPGAGAIYWLEDVSLSGARTMHGPVQPSGASSIRRIQARVVNSPQLSNLKSTAASVPAPVTSINPVPIAADTTLPPPTAVFNSGRVSRGERNATAIASATLAGEPAIKIGINQEGWYRVTESQLAAVGLDSHADVNSLRLVTEGTEIPMRVSTDNGSLSSIEFYGIGLDNQYTDTRVYWLVWDPSMGQRLQHIDGSKANLPVSNGYQAEAVRQDRTFYFAALTTNGDQDNFFGDIVSSTPSDEHLQLTGVDQADASTAEVDVTLQGVTDPANHDVQVSLNGTSIGEITFSGMDHGAFANTVPVSLLKEGDNIVTLTPLGGDSDVTTVDHVIITYQRHYLATNNELRFTVLGQTSIKVTGFSSPAIHVVDIDTPMSDVDVNVSQETDGTYSAAFSNTSAQPGVYYAYNDTAVSQPLSLAYHAPTSLSVSSNAADLLIVSHTNFISALAPLVVKRQSQGLNVKVVDIDDVYSEFNYGEHSPYALQQFLQLATNSWTKAPRWLLLVGDASVDPRNFLGYGSFDFVPTKIISTAELKTASDGWFTDFNQTGLEQIPTGRIPVRTATDAVTVVNKILAYESQPAGTWSHTAYLVADENIGADFQSEAATIATLLPAQLTPITLNVSDFATDHVTLVNQLNAGNLIVNYLGHGSTDIWASDSFFNETDAQSLTNGAMTPFFINMDCLNGFFHDVYSTSLAETLLLAPQGGAAAVWASSGLTDPAPQFGMDEALMQYLFTTPAQTIGEATKNAKQGVTDPDVRRTWILFGDPSMTLKSVTGINLWNSARLFSATMIRS